MDKPPEQGAKIIDLFSKRERPPKRLGAMGAKVVELSSIRSSRSDEAPDISPDHIQDAQIIEIPDMPSEIRQEVSELVNDTIKEFKRKESDDPQNYKEIAEKIVELLDKAYRRPDDKPRDNSTKELGVCILTLAVFNPETIEVLNTPNVLAELERIIELIKTVAKHMRKGGIFITSGIIDTKEADVVLAFKKSEDFEIIEINHFGEWVSIVATKR